MVNCESANGTTPNMPVRHAQMCDDVMLNYRQGPRRANVTTQVDIGSTHLPTARDRRLLAGCWSRAAQSTAWACSTVQVTRHADKSNISRYAAHTMKQECSAGL